MKNRIVYSIFIVLICSSFSLSLKAQDVTFFPYFNSLKGTIQPSNISDAGGGTGKWTNNGILLTPATTNSRGAVVLDGVTFNSENGLVVEFDYDMYGGSPGSFPEYGDGLSFFLYDATANTSGLIGALGAGLGYAFNRSTNAASRVPGLDKGYLGVGLDQFGNFKGRRFESNSRVNGLVDTWGSNGGSHITIRGAMHPSGISGGGLRGYRFSGYPVLFTQSTRNIINGAVGKVINLNSNNNNTVTYNNLSSFTKAEEFDIRGGVENSTIGSPGYRKAILELVPANPNIGGGYFVSFTIVSGTRSKLVIDKFHYKSSLYYQENANSNSSNSEGGSLGNSDIILLNAAPPKSFKLGFAASTGAASQAHLIKNLKVSIPYLPEPQEDQFNLCYAPSKQTKTLNPFANDIFFNGPLYGQVSSGNTRDFIDFSTFIFTNDKGVQLGSSAYAYNQPGVGQWTYSANTGEVSFTPVIGFKGSASIFYRAKGYENRGGPFAQEIYRSQPTEITVNVIDCGVIINPHIPANGKIRSGR